MPKIFRVSSLVPAAFILSGLYWFYLAFTSEMIISSDAIGYQDLGRMLYQNGFAEYFRTGPNREPFYPILVSWAMHIAEIFNVPYPSIQKPVQCLILLITQLLTLKILQKMNINDILRSACVLYIGFSPALVNSALSLYSEIATYPWILGIVLLTAQIWPTLTKTSSTRTILLALGIAACFIGVISVKALFIYLLPLYLIIFLSLALMGFAARKKHTLTNTLIFIGVLYITVSLFVGMVQALNKKHNGHYTFTDRGKSTFSIAAFLRTQGITRENLDYSIRIHPHLEFSQEGENIWTEERLKLMSRGVAQQDLDRETFKVALQRILQNPFSYLFFYILQAVKIFFWESMRIGFVVYPGWIEKVFGNNALEYFLHILSGVLTLAAASYSLLFIKNNAFSRYQPTAAQGTAVAYITAILMILIPFVVLNSLVIALPRFILPMAPLYLVMTVFYADNLLKRKRKT